MLEKKSSLYTHGINRHLHPFQTGQSLVELGLYSFIFLVIVAVGFTLLAPSLSRFLSDFGFKRQSEVVENQHSSQIIIGQMQVVSEQIETVIDIEQIDLPNCNGSSEITISRELSKTTSQSIQFTNSIDVGFDINTVLSDISARIYSDLEIENTNEISQTTTVEVSAAPGTSMTYPVEWLEVKVVGTIEVFDLFDPDAEVYLVDFSIPNALRINVLEPIRTACP